MAQHIDCPRCERTNEIPEEFIGRYFRCPNCQCRYYVPVPALGGGPSGPVYHYEHAPEAATIDDMLRDSQEGQGAILRAVRQEAAILVRQLGKFQWMIIATIVLSALQLLILFLLWRGR
jgi:hypothetical protein